MYFSSPSSSSLSRVHLGSFLFTLTLYFTWFDLKIAQLRHFIFIKRTQFHCNTKVKTRLAWKRDESYVMLSNKLFLSKLLWHKIKFHQINLLVFLLTNSGIKEISWALIVELKRGINKLTHQCSHAIFSVIVFIPTYDPHFVHDNKIEMRAKE